MTRVIVVLLLLAACQNQVTRRPASHVVDRESTGHEAPTAIVVSQGLSSPEAVVHDEVADVYLVSNVNGGATDADDNGFISRISPSGQVLSERWIDGARPDITLHGPKGLLIVGDKLYVADVGAVRVFDRRTGTPLPGWDLPGTAFLNDLALGADGRVLVTDTGINLTPRGDPVEVGPSTVYALPEGGAPTPVAQGEALHGPNGIERAGDQVYLVTFLDKEIQRLDAAHTVVARLPDGELDGLIVMADGTFVVSSWPAEGLFHVIGGQARRIMTGVKTPASIAYDSQRHRLLVPLLTENVLRIEDWP